MSNRVPADQIERIVGARRHRTLHQARAVSAEQMVYILHPFSCLEVFDNLLDCPYSLALDGGIYPVEWQDCEDKPMIVAIEAGHLVPWVLWDLR